MSKTSSEEGGYLLVSPGIKVCIDASENKDAIATDDEDIYCNMINRICNSPESDKTVENCMENRSYSLTQMAKNTFFKRKH